MKKFLYFLLGFITNVIILSAFGNIAFYTQSIIYTIILFALFNQKRKSYTSYFLFGFITTAELLGVEKFGFYFIFGATLIILQYIFEEYVKITSTFTQFLICSLICVLIYCLSFHGLDYFLHNFLKCLLIYLATAATCFLFQSSRKIQRHELI